VVATKACVKVDERFASSPAVDTGPGSAPASAELRTTVFAGNERIRAFLSSSSADDVGVLAQEVLREVVAAAAASGRGGRARAAGVAGAADETRTVAQ
jgi:hypothetical protein